MEIKPIKGNLICLNIEKVAHLKGISWYEVISLEPIADIDSDPEASRGSYTTWYKLKPFGCTIKGVDMLINLDDYRGHWTCVKEIERPVIIETLIKALQNTIEYESQYHSRINRR